MPIISSELFIEETVDNNDLYSVYHIELIPMPEFRELYTHNVPGIPVRNNKSPERKYILCNIRTMHRIYDVREILSKEEWQQKVFFMGSRVGNGISTYFPLLNFTNGIIQGRKKLFNLHDEVRWLNQPDLWTSRAIAVAVYRKLF